MAQIPSEAEHLFTGKHIGHLATLNPDGSPQSTPLWVDLDDGAALVNTTEGRVKHRNISRDPRVALSIHAEGNPDDAIQVQGRAEIDPDNEAGEAHFRKLSLRYFGSEDYPWAQPGEKRVTIRIVPERVSYLGG